MYVNCANSVCENSATNIGAPMDTENERAKNQ